MLSRVLFSLQSTNFHFNNIEGTKYLVQFQGRRKFFTCVFKNSNMRKSGIFSYRRLKNNFSTHFFILGENLMSINNSLNKKIFKALFNIKSINFRSNLNDPVFFFFFVEGQK